MVSGLDASVVIRATEVVTAVGADQLTAVAGEAMAAGEADLAVVVDGQVIKIIGMALGRAGRRGADRTTL